jgi:hypothetical protein
MKGMQQGMGVLFNHLAAWCLEDSMKRAEAPWTRSKHEM